MRSLEKPGFESGSEICQHLVSGGPVSSSIKLSIIIWGLPHHGAVETK